MELDAVAARLLQTLCRFNEALLDVVDLLHRQRARMAALLERARDDVDEVLVVDGTRASVVDLRDEAHIVRMGNRDSLAELVRKAVLVDVDLFRIGEAQRVYAAVARDDRADAVLRQYLIHVVFGRRHVAVFPCEETVHGRADDPVLQSKVLQLQRRFDDAHDKSPMNPR